MRRSLHTDEEIAFLLSEAEGGTPITAICASAHVSLGTFYRWRRRLGGLKPAGVVRLDRAEAENAVLRAEVQRLRAALASRSVPADRASTARPAPRHRGAEACMGRYAYVRTAN